MVNRSIEAKKIKMKRRGKQRRYGLQIVNTGSGPAAGAVSALYRHKLVDDQVDKYLAAKFPQRFHYTDDMLIARNELNKQKSSLLGEKENPFPLGEVKLCLRNLQQKMQEDNLESHFKLYNKSYHKIDLFFNTAKTKWTLIEMKYIGNEQFMRRSEIFSSKPLAVQALRLSMVEWVETVSLHGLPTEI